MIDLILSLDLLDWFSLVVLLVAIIFIALDTRFLYRKWKLNKRWRDGELW